MDEKILIKSKKNRLVELILKVLLVISIIAFLFLFFVVGEFIYDHEFGFAIACSSPALAVMLISGTTLLSINNCEIIVTNKRVYGKATFRKRVDLPLDSISVVGTSILSGIDVGTSSGRIHFKLLKNNIEIHSVISNLLIRRHQIENLHNIQNSNNADELKKFKELLDSGIITQDEFDKKKKQLLNL